ncbi:MAG: hypothetical protein MI924_04610 [Chloroflexales bacterium]|nr:hypothetical protein [Chloroflexales bacterium]
MARFSKFALLLIVLAVTVGAALRLLVNNQPFPSSDHAELAAIVTFFYPRSWESLLLSARSSWNIVTSVHGVLPPLVGMLAGTIYGVLGIHISEFWWNSPFVLIHLASIPLAAVLTRRLAGPWAGVIAAFLIALMPIHVALSRASGVTHTPLVFLLHLITILAFMRYAERPTPQRARWASVALALALLADQLFPLLLVLAFGVILLSLDESSLPLGQRIKRARALMFQPQVLLLPLLVLCWSLFLLTLHGMGRIDSGGIATRMFAGSDRQPGLYLDAFWNNARYVLGTIALLVAAVLALLRFPALLRMEQQAIPLFWALLYLTPFALFTRPHVFELFLMGTAPLLINAAVVLGAWINRPQWQGRLLGGLTAGALAALLFLRTLSMVFAINVVSFVDTGQSVGGMYADQGLKTAAWWIRSYTAPDTLVFADGTYEPYQLWYYLRRPFLGITDAESPTDAYELLKTAKQQPSFYLVAPEHVLLLEENVEEHIHLAVQVTTQNAPLLLIYSREPVTERITLDIAEGNDLYDDDFGRWKSMFNVGERQ